MESDGFLPCLQEHAICFYPKSYESILQHLFLRLIKIMYAFILPSKRATARVYGVCNVKSKIESETNLTDCTSSLT
jgi:hypothetical protein